jgi:hypothetical protein
MRFPRAEMQTARYFITLCFSCAAGLLFAQQTESFPMLKSIADKEVWFDQQVGIENSGIINGDEYKAGLRALSSHPFFTQNEVMGSVEYKGQLFYVPLMFDVHQGVLILKYKDEASASRFIELNKSDIKGFRILTSIFKKIEGKGFYEVLVETPRISLLVQRSKQLDLKSGVAEYNWFNTYYMVIDGEWKVLRNNASVKKIFQDKERQRAVSGFMRDEKIRVRKFKDDQLIRLMLFCRDLQNKTM